MPPPVAELAIIEALLVAIADNKPGCTFVDWSCAEVEDAQIERLALALKGNTFVRKIHANFNAGVTDVGAAALEAALPGCSVAALWLDNTGVGDEANAQLQWCCIVNSVRLIALNDNLLTSINWNLVGLPHTVEHNADLLAASRAAEPQWSVEGAAMVGEQPEWAVEPCDTAVAGALADALATNTNVINIALMMNRELSPTSAAYLQGAFDRSSVKTKNITFLPTAAREAREGAVIAARKAALKAAMEKEEKELAEAEAGKKKKGGGRRPTPPKGGKKGTATGRVPSR